MSIKAMVERLRSMGVPDAAIPGVMELIDEERQSACRPRTSTERSRAHRARSQGDATKTLQNRPENVAKSLHPRPEIVASEPVLAHAFFIGEELDIDISSEANASSGAEAPLAAESEIPKLNEKPLTPDAALYRRAREIAGEKAAAFVTRLKAQNGGDIADTRQMVEQAALADNPFKYLAGIVSRGQSRVNFSQSRPPPRETTLSLAERMENFVNKGSKNEQDGGRRPPVIDGNVLMLSGVGK